MKSGRSSFRSLFDNVKSIEIPVIQRDYAQGRNDEHSREVRRRFLEAIGEALSGEPVENASLDLDFVYGRRIGTTQTLEPLDGQQRLTTLFLLHWYLACLDGEFDEFRTWITLPAGGSCFTYRTRPAAREFFDAMVRWPAPLDNLDNSTNAISNWVTDAVWFVRSWHRDPTVRGCLTMLDAIHLKFCGFKMLWPRLVSMESPAITFRLLPLDNFNLSDDLYVKMNARGKALTQFEVLKAELESFVGEEFIDETYPNEPGQSWREYISRQFDIEWTNFLWGHRGNSVDIDPHFTHLIRALAVVHCVNNAEETRLSRQVDQLLANTDPGLSFYEELGCLDRAFVEQLVSIMGTLANHSESPKFLGRLDYMDEEAVFRRVLLARDPNQDGGLTLVDWVMFYAWCSFLRLFPNELESKNVQASFHDWIRIVRNLTINSDIDRNERLVLALRGIKRLSLSCGVDFLSKIADGALEESVGFNQQQQKEERLKARLILRNADWRPLIERAEKHAYFRGDIDFLLRFSELFDRVTKAGGCDWSDDEDLELRQNYIRWYDRVCAIFPENSKSWPASFPNYLWERALLATGDYLLPSKSNLSFLDEKDRDASWKRLLRADTRVPDRDARRDVVRRVLEQVDPKDAVGSLEKIVAAGVQGKDTTPVPGFRRRVVAEAQLIGYCDLRRIRIEEGTAFLLARTQRNGYHVDLYVYDIFLRLETQHTDLVPFNYVNMVHQTGTYETSQIILRASNSGPVFTVAKHGAMILLTLELPRPDSNISTLLTGWTSDDDTSLYLSLEPDSAEAAIFDVVAAIRTTSGQTQS